MKKQSSQLSNQKGIRKTKRIQYAIEHIHHSTFLHVTKDDLDKIATQAAMIYNIRKELLIKIAFGKNYTLKDTNRNSQKAVINICKKEGRRYEPIRIRK